MREFATPRGGLTGLALQEDRLPRGLWGACLKGGLLAASWFYGAGHLSRMAAYRAGILKTRKLPCWALSVGNLTVGGTGKTPAVLALAQSLCAKGRRVAVLSRGYGGEAAGPATVVSDGERVLVHPPEASDEACLLALRLPGVPVLTGADRYTLGLKAAADFGVEGVILDDGFQHVQLARDLNLLLLDAGKPFGNGHLLPRGTLREPQGAVARADGVLLTRADTPEPEAAARLRRKYPSLLIAVSRFIPDGVRDLVSGEEIQPDGRRAFLVCGIARPSDFRNLAARAGFEEAGMMAFPDHHRYGPADLRKVQDKARACGAEGLLTTEKDAVKLRPYPPGQLPCWSLRLRLEILSGESHWDRWTEKFA
ncbi:MAG: tetraacyldisaccharide 4'-kinase [Nitrospinota bacterium]